MTDRHGHVNTLMTWLSQLVGLVPHPKDRRGRRVQRQSRRGPTERDLASPPNKPRTFPGPAIRRGGPNDPLTRARKARVRGIVWLTAKILVWVLGLGLALGAAIYFLVWIAFA